MRWPTWRGCRGRARHNPLRPARQRRKYTALAGWGFVRLAVGLVFLVVAAHARSPSTIDTIQQAKERGDYAVIEKLATVALGTRRLGANDRATLLGQRGYALILEGRSSDGERDIVQALDTAPDKEVRAVIFDEARDAYYGSGNQYVEQGRYDLAIARYTAGMNYTSDEGELYSERAYAYFRARDFDRAIADYQRYIDAVDNASNAIVGIGNAYEAKLDFGHAMAGYNVGIAEDSSNETLLGYRGRAYAVLGNYAAAARDLGRTIALNPQDASSLVWLHIVHMRTGKEDARWLKQKAVSQDLHKWPGVVLSYFLRRTSAKDLVTFAQTDPNTARDEQRCDAWFYLGEEALARGDRPAARDLLRKTVTGCDAVDYEWAPAAVELRRLDGSFKK